MPAARDQGAERAPGGALVIHMKGLGIVSIGKPQHGLAGEPMLAQRPAHSGFELFEEQAHHGRRTLMRLTPVTSIFFSPAVENTSQRMVMMPISGVFEDRRFAITVKRALSVSPG